MIASEVVVKKGKKYVWQHSVSDQNAITKKQIKKQKRKLEAKREVLSEIAKKYCAIHQLLSRNKPNLDSDIIRFPFIIVATEEHPDNSVVMESNIAHTDICIKFKKEIQLYGDVEVLQKLNIKTEFFKLPPEVLRLLKITC